MKADYVETCNCDYGCPCNFSGFPTYGNCQVLLLFHIRSGSYHTQPIVKNIIDNRRSGFGGRQGSSDKKAVGCNTLVYVVHCSDIRLMISD
jgi:hypothetical protein